MEKETLLKTLENSKKTRDKIIDALTRDEKNLEDPEYSKILSGIVKDNESVAISLLKIQSEENIAKNTTNNGAIVAEILNNLNHNNFISHSNRKPPTPDLEKPELVHNETLIGGESDSFKDIIPD